MVSTALYFCLSNVNVEAGNALPTDIDVIVAVNVRPLESVTTIFDGKEVAGFTDTTALCTEAVTGVLGTSSTTVIPRSD